MKLYSYQMSPFAARVRLAIYRKSLDIEIVKPPETGTKSDEFLAINPIGLVPVLMLDSGMVISESAVILEYLEDVFPTPSLRPSNPTDLALARLFLRLPDIYFQGAPRHLLGMFRNPSTYNAEQANIHVATLEKALGFIEHYLTGTHWAAGPAPSIGDCALVPILNVVALVGAAYKKPDLIARFKKLEAYWQRAQADDINALVITEMTNNLPAELRELRHLG